jgi:hypothetical protein
LTYGNFSIKQGWKSFIESLPVEAIFLHKDEFTHRYKMDAALPSIFIQSNALIEKFISRYEIERCRSLEELKKLIVQKIEGYVQHNHSYIQ